MRDDSSPNVPLITAITKPLRLFVLLLSLVATGCAGTRPLKLSDITPEEISRLTAEHFERLRTFRGRARIIYESPENSITGYARVAIQRPDSVFVKVEAMLGVSVGFFFANGRAFVLYSPFENTAYYGRVEDVDLSHLFQMAVAYHDLVESLSGVVKVPETPGRRVSIEKGHYVLEGPNDSGRDEIWVDPKKHVVSKWVTYDSLGDVVALREFKRFRKRRGVLLPQIIRFSRPQLRERFTFYFLKQEANVRLKKSDFAFKIPKSAAQVRVKPKEGLPPSWIR